VYIYTELQSRIYDVVTSLPDINVHLERDDVSGHAQQNPAGSTKGETRSSGGPTGVIASNEGDGKSKRTHNIYIYIERERELVGACGDGVVGDGVGVVVVGVVVGA
jgi:hypothetical protein